MELVGFFLIGAIAVWLLEAVISAFIDILTKR